MSNTRGPDIFEVCDEQARDLAALRAENAKLKEALEPFVCKCAPPFRPRVCDDEHPEETCVFRRARTLLEATP